MSDTFTSQSKLRTNSSQRFEAVLDDYGDASGSYHETLVDLLADAMHWCDTTGGDFHIALTQAGRHYLAELVDTQTCPRRLSLCQ